VGVQKLWGLHRGKDHPGGTIGSKYTLMTTQVSHLAKAAGHFPEFTQGKVTLQGPKS
jgi:hypothetical protein